MLNLDETLLYSAEIMKLLFAGKILLLRPVNPNLICLNVKKNWGTYVPLVMKVIDKNLFMYHFQNLKVLNWWRIESHTSWNSTDQLFLHSDEVEYSTCSFRLRYVRKTLNCTTIPLNPWSHLCIMNLTIFCILMQSNQYLKAYPLEWYCCPNRANIEVFRHV